MQRTTLFTRVTPVTGHAVRSRAGPVEPSLCDVRRVDRGRVPRDLQGAGPAAPAHYDHMIIMAVWGNIVLEIIIVL